jgi:transposase-like protein
MSESNNGQTLDERPIPQGDQRRYTGEILLRTRPKTYRAIAREFAQPNASVNGIARRCRVSNHTVMGIREREAKGIAERKKNLATMLANVAELGAERMEETIGKASLRDAAIGTGIAVDKMQALTGHQPCVNVAVVLPSAGERAKLDAIDAKLDAIFRPKLPDLNAS